MFSDSFTYYRGLGRKNSKRVPEKEDLAKKDPSCILLKESVWDGHFTGVSDCSMLETQIEMTIAIQKRTWVLMWWKQPMAVIGGFFESEW